MNGTARNHWRRACEEMIARFSTPARTATSGSLHVRDPINVDRLLAMFVLASLPAATIGAWSVGTNILNTVVLEPSAPAAWQMDLLEAIGLIASPDNPIAALALGLMFMLPLILVTALVSAMWEVVFAAVRKRAVDPGWPMMSCLYVLLLPPDTPLILAATGITFGTVLGKQIFGGTGRYIVSPAVVGALFLHYSYPELGAGAKNWLTAAGIASDTAADQGASWWQAFWGTDAGLLGTSSALACTLGALWLTVVGIASMRTLFGALLGLLGAATVASLFGESLSAHWHFALGSFAFCWAFVLTDPTTLPMTRAGRWLHGAVFGALVITMREADPGQPESTLFAVLLAALFVPLIDYMVLRAQHARFSNSLEIET